MSSLIIDPSFSRTESENCATNDENDNGKKILKIIYISGEDESGPIDGALASGDDEEAPKNLNPVRYNF